MTMANEIKTKANPDYSQSAVNLTNSIQVVVTLRAIRGLTSQIAELKATIENLIPQELKDSRASLQMQLDAATQGIYKDIDAYGSYQDQEKGEYALKQRRESILYKPALVRCYAPSRVASFVIIESVDSKAMEAMAKAGQIDPETAKKCGEVKETFAYIIR